MRFIIMERTAQAPATGAPPSATQAAAIARYHADLARAGVLLDASVPGQTLIEVRTREEATEWARRFPATALSERDSMAEARQLAEPDDAPAAAPTGRSRPHGGTS